MVNSHRARMLLPGVADLETLRYFAGLVGEEEARELTRTTGAGGTSRSTARRRRPLIAAEALRQLPDGHALLLYGRLRAGQLRLRMWFDDRRLRRLAGRMSWLEPDDDALGGSRGDGDEDRRRAALAARLARPLSARALALVRAAVERRLLAARALPPAVRSGWWEDQIQVEALAAFAAWVQRYDSGEWDDPPGKLALLYDLERLAALLRDGNEPFHPDRDRLAFARHLLEIGCQPPPAGCLSRPLRVADRTPGRAAHDRRAGEGSASGARAACAKHEPVAWIASARADGWSPGMTWCCRRCAIATRLPSTIRAFPPRVSSGPACSASTAPSTLATVHHSPHPFEPAPLSERFATR